MNIELKAGGKSKGGKLEHFWNLCVGAGRANEGLRAGWLEHLDMAAKHCGFKYCRFHGLFHDDMFVFRTVNGKLSYNWQYIDDLFDRMLDLGVRPFVEFGFCPRELASVKEITFWWKGHGSPPVDYAKWGELVEAFLRHCLERYGEKEVLQWYFEVWNEPNLDFFFVGKKSQYFELYKTTSKVVKAVNPGFRVGGPATSNFVPDNRFEGELEAKEMAITHKVEDLDSLEWKGVWIEEFIAFCKKESLSLDFISTHPYPTDYGLDNTGEVEGRSRGADSTQTDLRWIRKTIDKSAFPKAEIHLTEWNSSPSHRDHMHDHLPAATYIVKCNLESTGLVDSLSYWTFTDVFEEDGGGPTVFHGGFGLINFQGIAKPAFHAYRFLNCLGDQVLSKTKGGIVTRDSNSGMISCLFYHYPEEMPLAVPMSMHAPEIAEQTQSLGKPGNISLLLQDLKPDAMFEIEILDIDNGCVLETWKKIGCPEPPSREEVSLLKKSAWNTKREYSRAGADGRIHIERAIAPWSLVMVREQSCPK